MMRKLRVTIGLIGVTLLLAAPSEAQNLCQLECEDFVFGWTCYEATCYCENPAHEAACINGYCTLGPDLARCWCVPGNGNVVTIQCDLGGPWPEALDRSSSGHFCNGQGLSSASRSLTRSRSDYEWVLYGEPEPATRMRPVIDASSQAMVESTQKQQRALRSDGNRRNLIVRPLSNMDGMSHTWRSGGRFLGTPGSLLVTFKVDSYGNRYDFAVENSSLQGAEREDLVLYLLNGLSFTVEKRKKAPFKVLVSLEIDSEGYAQLFVTY